MKKIVLIIFLCLGYEFANAQSKSKVPEFLLGNFTDDYQIKYTITDSLWVQHPNARYHILKWDMEKQYLIVKNDAANQTGKNQYTHIDFMQFNDMQPYLWGFCLTKYNAETAQIAEETAAADRANPKKGCNGYPFSRMKRTN